MASNLRINTAASNELESLLAQQAEIQARIATLLPSNTHPQHQRSPIHKQHQRRQYDPRMPRSMSGSGIEVSQHPVGLHILDYLYLIQVSF